jgi:hypothetical protein
MTALEQWTKAGARENIYEKNVNEVMGEDVDMLLSY